MLENLASDLECLKKNRRVKSLFISKKVKKKLRSYRKTVQGLEDLIKEKSGSEVVFRSTGGGVIPSKAMIYPSEKSRGLYSVMKKGEGLDWHVHDECEFMIVESGHVRFEVDGEIMNAVAPFCVVVNSNTKHRMIEAIQDSTLISITIPPSKDFPRWEDTKGIDKCRITQLNF